jgi:hypothetical protein
MYNGSMALKPQDIYVALKIVSAGPPRPSYAQLASALAMSPSEVHASVKRAQASYLLHGPSLNNRPNFTALEEFLVRGLKYVFPADRSELTRGVPTSYAGKPLNAIIAPGTEPIPVWPYEHGQRRGVGFAPLYRTAPIAALKDASFYE